MANQEQGRFTLGGDDLAGAKYGGHCSGCRHPKHVVACSECGCLNEHRRAVSRDRDTPGGRDRDDRPGHRGAYR